MATADGRIAHPGLERHALLGAVAKCDFIVGFTGARVTPDAISTVKHAIIGDQPEPRFSLSDGCTNYGVQGYTGKATAQARRPKPCRDAT
jgi:hypothetical protein